MSGKKEMLAMTLDYTGKECYEINFSLRVKIKKIIVGEILKLVTDNPESKEKIHKWCSINNQELFLSDIDNGLYVYYIKRIT